MRALILVLATGFGAGWSPIAPGTVGSVVGLAAAVGFARMSLSPGPALLVLAGLIWMSCAIAGRAEQALGEHDSGRIVIDEICGMVCALAFLRLDATTMIVGFLLFRFLDVAKPWPANVLQSRLRGGAAVVLDDVAVGVWTNLALRILV